MVRLRTSQTGGFYYAKKGNEVLAKITAVGNDGGQKRQPSHCVHRCFYRILRGGEYVFRVYAGGNAVFLHLIPFRVNGDYYRTCFRIYRLLFRGFGGVFIPFRRVCVYAVDRVFPWGDLNDRRVDCQRFAE